MKFRVHWTPESAGRFNEIVEYLRQNWGESSVEKFISRVDRYLDSIASDTVKFMPAGKKRNLYKVVIHKHITLVYLRKPRKQEIYLITFWANRRNPKERPY